MSTPENSLFEALIEITGASMDKVAGEMPSFIKKKMKEGDDDEKDEKKPSKSHEKSESAEKEHEEEEAASEEKEAQLKLATIVDHPVFLAGFERRLQELRTENGFIGD